jgi:hypothetical protein
MPRLESLTLDFNTSPLAIEVVAYLVSATRSTALRSVTIVASIGKAHLNDDWWPLARALRETSVPPRKMGLCILVRCLMNMRGLKPRALVGPLLRVLEPVMKGVANVEVIASTIVAPVHFPLARLRAGPTLF